MVERFYIVHLPSVCGNCALFWCPNSSGYTHDLAQAGLYTAEEAEEIEAIRGEDKRVPVEVADELARRHVSRESLLARIRWYADGTPMEEEAGDPARQQDRP